MNLTVEDCHIVTQHKKGIHPGSAQDEGQSPPTTQAEGGPEDQPSSPPSHQEEGTGPETRTVEVEIHPRGNEESHGVPPPDEESQVVSHQSNHGDEGVVPQGNNSQGSVAEGEDSQGVPPQGDVVPPSEDLPSEQTDNGERKKAVPDIPTPEVPLETVEVRTEPTSARAEVNVQPLPTGEGRVAAKADPVGTVVADPLKVLDKGKRVGPADLLPLTQGVASNNAKLVEPQVPTDFTPTSEWVCPC